MGYRKPSYDEEFDEDVQFEWDAGRQQWLFRRTGVAAPVLVTDKERERHETVKNRGRTIAYMLFVAVFLFGRDWIEPYFTTDDAQKLAELTSLGAALLLMILGYAAADRFAAKPFLGRSPVGLATPASEQRRLEDGWSWKALAWAPILIAFLVWLHVPPSGLADWIWLSLIALFAAAMLFDLLRVRQLSRS